MKYLILMLTITLSVQLYARESLFKTETAPQVKEEVEAIQNKPTLKVGAQVAGNLKEEKQESTLTKAGNGGVILPKNQKFTHPQLKPGMNIVIELESPVIAFPDGKTSVVAKVVTRGLEGMVLIGEATLEKNSKHIELNFDKLSSQKENQIYDIKAVTLVEGEYHTNDGKLMLAEFMSAAAAAFVDASVQRDQSLLGPYVAQPSLENAAKKAASSALGKSSERFAEKVKGASEFGVVRPTITQALILE